MRLHDFAESIKQRGSCWEVAAREVLFSAANTRKRKMYTHTCTGFGILHHAPPPFTSFFKKKKIKKNNNNNREKVLVCFHMDCTIEFQYAEAEKMVH